MVEEACPTATPPAAIDHTPHTLSSMPRLAYKVNRAGSFDDDRGDEDNEIHGNRSISKFGFPSTGGPTHRRLGSWSQAINGTSPTNTHRRQQSLVSGQSSKSTSAYSTLSERSTAGSVEGGEADSMSGSLPRSRPVMNPSRVEQSRVDPQAVIDNLFSSHNFSRSEAEPSVEQGGLKIYVDKSLGTVTVAGSNLDR